MAETQPQTAIFAGGCFWCMESEFTSEPGVLSTEVGFTGGHVANPTYEQVSGGKTGHREALKVTYDPTQTTYEHLLTIFWNNIDPLDATGQFCDKGEQYKAALFVATPEEKNAAEASAAEVTRKLGRPVVTDILPRAPFYKAEDYHQAYYKKSATSYQRYRQSCGRDGRLNDLKKAMTKPE
jgi:peptide-methionine (S)-S-oxide reductase